MARLEDGTLVAHWLQKSGPDTYAYDVRLSHSRDDGKSWSSSFKPHSDGTKTEHGFATLFQMPGAGLGLVWLDGRNMKEGGHGGHDDSMTLRFGSFGKDWKQTAETELDARVCECCPTTAALTAEFAASIPDVTRTALVPRATGPLEFSESFSGLGDTSVLGWYRLNPIKRWTPLLNVGLSLPTGRIEQPRFRNQLQDGSLVPLSRLQRGSGTVDPIVALNLTWGSDPWTRFISVAARTPLYENSEGLRTGAVTEISAGVARYTRIRKIGVFGRASWLHRDRMCSVGRPCWWAAAIGST